MAKLWFKYGAMGASKSAQLLMTNYNYLEKGLNPLLLQPKIANRDGDKIVKSRIGLSAICEYVEDFIFPNDWKLTKSLVKEYDSIIIDEVQFLSIEEINILWKIVKKCKIPVLCFGLDTDFRLKHFPASKRLRHIIKKHPNKGVIEELKTVCWCGNGATCNARISNGKIIKTGEQIMMGANESYISLCKKHYKNGNLGPHYNI